MSGLMVYRGRPTQTDREQLPFTIAGLRFAPQGEQQVELHTGESLPFAYQLWLPKDQLASLKAPLSGKPQVIQVHYTLGSVALSGGAGARIEDDEDVAIKDVDDAGNILSGHTLDTSSLGEGTYRLIVKATAPGSAYSASAALTVKIVPSQTTVAMWTAFSDEKQHPAWQDDFLRGLAAEALDKKTEAALCYRRVLAAKPDASDARSHLEQLDKAAVAGNHASE